MNGEHEHRWELVNAGVQETRWPNIHTTLATWLCIEPRCFDLKTEGQRLAPPPLGGGKHKHRWRVYGAVVWFPIEPYVVEVAVTLVCGRCGRKHTPEKVTLTLPDHTLNEETASRDSGISVEQLRRLKETYQRQE